MAGRDLREAPPVGDAAAAPVPPTRFRPPSPQDLIVWPAAVGARFVVLVDVEEEFDWRRPLDRANRATTAMRAFPAAHERFRDMGVALWCMVDQPVADDPRAAAALTGACADGRSAIGAQLHAWVTPPHVAGEASFQGRLPPALEAAKIDMLSDRIERVFGRRPRTFRAGRYGIGAHSRRLLAERGFVLDASVRARYDYGDGGGPDFYAIGNAPYRVDGLVELPSGTVFTGRARRWGPALYRAAGVLSHGPGLLARTGMLSRVPLTPEGTTMAEGIAAIDAALADGERVLVFNFHSPSLAPGFTPYVRDASGLRRFWSWWEAILAHLGRRGVANASMGELSAILGIPGEA